MISMPARQGGRRLGRAAAGQFLVFVLLGGGCSRPPEGPPREPPAAAAPDPAADSPPPPEGARELVEHVRREEAAASLAEHAPAVLRPAWDRLVITAENGERRVFTDEVEEGDLRSIHRFAGALAPLRAYAVVQEYVPEGRAVLMVDGRTGEVFPVDDPPVASPDGNRFVTASLDLVAGHHPNRIRVYRVEPGGPVLEWEAEPRQWGARNPVWLDASTIRLERAIVDRQHEISTTSMVLRHEQGRWTVIPSREQAAQALHGFLAALGTGRYIEAAQMFGGSAETLREWNPDVSPSDLPSLLRAGCEQNGLRCLSRAEIVHEEDLAPGVYRFTARLYSDDGTPWVGPGSRSEFAFEVRRRGNDYLVMDLPPYAP